MDVEEEQGLGVVLTFGLYVEQGRLLKNRKVCQKPLLLPLRKFNLEDLVGFGRICHLESICKDIFILLKLTVIVPDAVFLGYQSELLRFLRPVLSVVPVWLTTF